MITIIIINDQPDRIIVTMPLYGYTTNIRSGYDKRKLMHENSARLIIDKQIPELLKVDLDTLLEITTDERNLIIWPKEASKKKEVFRSAMEKTNRLHGRTY